jgi:hypothetical protein
VNFDQVADELYALPREQFTAARNDRAAEARTNGRKDLAEKIKKLPKPTTAAWLANQIVRKYRSRAERLIKVGDSLRKAHKAVKGKALQELSRERHELMSELVEKGRTVAREEDISVSEAAATELEGIFTAAVADPAAGERLLEGRVATSLAGAGNSAEAWLLSAGTPAKRPASPRTKARDGGQNRRRELNRAMEMMRSAERAVTDVQRELAAAERRLHEAQQSADDLRARLAEAEQNALAAQQEVTRLGR